MYSDEDVPLLWADMPDSSDGRRPPRRHRNKSVVGKAAHRLSRWLGTDAQGVDPLSSPEARAAGQDDDADELAYEYDGAQPWYHGLVTLDAAERRLKIHGARDGLFLIRRRRRSSGDHAVSVCMDCKVQHFLIKFNRASADLRIADGPRFQELDDLVSYYGQQSDGLPCRLSSACPPTNDTGAPVIATTRLGSDAAAASEPVEAPYEEYKHKLKLRDRRTIKRKMAEMPTFEPWFLRLVTFIQLLVLCIEIGYGGLSEIAFSPQTETIDVSVGFLETQQLKTRTKPANLFIGPTSAYLVAIGAKYSPCMRKDIGVFAELAKQRQDEETNFGCCIDSVSGDCGVTTALGCPTDTFLARQPCPETCFYFRVRPCCVGFNGTCRVVTKEECDFDVGVWNQDAESCSEVACLDKSCGSKLKLKNPERPDQWWRFIIPIFIHQGVIHLAFNLFLQINIGFKIERACGWLRMLLLYMISGVAGNIFSGIFSPDIPSVGANGALYGLLAATVVDLFQSWQVLDKPYSRLGSVLLQTAVFLLIGTLPWVDNFAHVGGFLAGLLTSIVFLPYITFGTWDAVRKRCLIMFCLPLLLALFAVLLVIFYEVQGTDFCPQCGYIQCVPYTSTICESVQAIV